MNIVPFDWLVGLWLSGTHKRRNSAGVSEYLLDKAHSIITLLKEMFYLRHPWYLEHHAIHLQNGSYGGCAVPIGIGICFQAFVFVGNILKVTVTNTVNAPELNSAMNDLSSAYEKALDVFRVALPWLYLEMAFSCM